MSFISAFFSGVSGDERERVPDGTDDRFWMRLEILVPLLCYFFPVGGTVGISWLIERGLDWQRRGLG